MARERKNWEEYTVRFQPFEAQHVRDKAHRARLPFSVYIRECAVGDVPKAAGPLADELTGEARKLLNISRALVSNTSQLDAHAARLGRPLSRLSDSDGDGLLLRLGSKALDIGLLIKSGELDQQETLTLLTRLEGPARGLNEDLARPLNEGAQPSLGTWKSVLDALQNALREDGDE